MAEWEWSVTVGVCVTPGAEGVPTYGVQAVRGTDVWTWADVDTDAALVAALADRLNLLQPSRCHFADMVLDYIHECAAAG